MMRLVPWFLSRGDVLGGVFVLAMLVLVAFVFVRHPDFKAASGFGPDWECMHAGEGEPICVKKIAR
jgi:hypothetical protein